MYGRNGAGPKSILEVLRQRAADDPTTVVYRFAFEDNSVVGELTYADVDARARAIGGWLQSKGCHGRPVSLIFLPGLDYVAAFFGTLYAGAIAVPLSPPASPPAVARVEAVLADTNCRMVLTSDELLSRMARLVGGPDTHSEIEVATTQSILAASRLAWSDPAVQNDSIAFLQYTSGSTAAPKGVQIRHDNLLVSLDLMVDASELSGRSVGVSWLPHFHDMGLIGGILMPMYAGFPVTLMAPASFIVRPRRWLEEISSGKATVSGAPNFAYEHCIRSIGQDELQGLDLSSWRTAFSGSEPIRIDTLERFATKFAPCGFRMESFFPCYGLAEATLMVSGGPARQCPTVRSVDRTALKHGVIAEKQSGGNIIKAVASGKILDGLHVVIVDPESRTCRDETTIGEIWVAGKSVGAGYWNRADETAATFNAFLADTGTGPFLRTGDLGFVRDGFLFVMGRQKDLIIIRGQNHHPNDIERTVEEVDPSLRPGCGAAFSIDIDDEERLAVVYEVDRSSTSVSDLVFDKIRRSVAMNHGIEIYAITMIKHGTIPRTTSGKIQRQACRSGYLAGDLTVIQQWRADEMPRNSRAADKVGYLLSLEAPQRQSEIQLLLRRELAIKLGVDPSSIEPGQSVYALGLDSIRAAQLCNQLGLIFGIELSLSELLLHPTIEEIAAHIAGRLESKRGESPHEMAKLVSWIDQLSEDELATLLDREREAGPGAV
jgi:acyl-CoA synthetase (AMP-forming)/AMP-acid ligase II/acyl carrier protein